ncbi:MAG: hypothetical protein GTN49_10735 [candidate division Zixibacteria bacterium]|nr:hypothetical protein [candidate division Zixibacteria bacterium]
MSKEITIPDAIENVGIVGVKIYRALLTHEYMSKEKIIERADVAPTTVSTYLTQLRRTGWIEARGTRLNRQWRRREEWAEPQDDFVHRRSRAERERESDEGDALHHLTEAARHLNEALRLVKPLIELRDAVEKSLTK